MMVFTERAAALRACSMTSTNSESTVSYPCEPRVGSLSLRVTTELYLAGLSDAQER